MRHRILLSSLSCDAFAAPYTAARVQAASLTAHNLMTTDMRGLIVIKWDRVGQVN